MAIHQPTDAELEQVEARAAKIGDKRLLDNARFWLLYSAEHGIVANVVPVYERDPDPALGLKKTPVRGAMHLTQIGTKRRPLSYRQFSEHRFQVVNKDSQLVPWRLNPAQRMREVAVLRQQRAGLPVRQIDLKARQIGFTTDAIVRACWEVLTKRRSKVLLVSQDDETAQEALDKVNVGVGEMRKLKGGTWTISLDHDAQRRKKIAAPMNSQIKIASAIKKHPGRGFTPKTVIGDELAFWEDAPKKATALFNGVPMRRDTAVFLFSTANGATGYYHHRFKVAWKARHKSITQRPGGFNANFFPWYCDPGYRWTQTFGLAHNGAIPRAKLDELESTLLDYERWLLAQKFLQRWQESDTWERIEWTRDDGSRAFKHRRRGVGWRNVDVDQLLWRREKIIEHHGDPLRPETWYEFMAEFPATPDEAFVATGRLVFDQIKLKEMLAKCAPAPWVGDIMKTGEATGPVDVPTMASYTHDTEIGLGLATGTYNIEAVEAMNEILDPGAKLREQLKVIRARFPNGRSGG